MSTRPRKYIPVVILLSLWAHMVFGISAAGLQDGMAEPSPSISGTQVPAAGGNGTTLRAINSVSDSTVLPDNSTVSNNGITEQTEDTVSVSGGAEIDSIVFESQLEIVKTDTARKSRPFLDDVIKGSNKDSVVYDLRSKMVYLYRDGNISYKEMTLSKADYAEIDLDAKEMFAHGSPDTAGVMSRPEFSDRGQTYTMDTVTYNLNSGKAFIKNAAVREGDGFLIARYIKKMADNSVNVAGGIYTTCDHIDHPHFYINMSKARMVTVPSRKMIFGPAYLVIEDVPLYFPILPFGFFPVTSGRSSGFVVPSYGEESRKGFFMRDGGYYFAFNDYIDMTVLGGIYTLGSWETSLSSRYIKKYKYSGGLTARFSKDIIGERGDADYVNMNNFSLQWTHSQDPKANPGSTFSASVNLSSSGYNRYGATNMNDYLNTQTNSSVSYSKNWAGKPYNFSTNIQHSQNSRDSTVSLSFPNAVFSVSRLSPFKRKNPTTKEQWYEKISVQYTGTLSNSVTAKERDLFTETMFKDMRSGVNHVVPVSASMNVFSYLNLTPSFNYNERWVFKRIEKGWDDEQNAVINSDTTFGFYRVYNYNLSVSASTKLYGDFGFKGNFPVRQIRHVMTPTVGFTYTPDFGDPRFGFWEPYQSDANGTISYYSPYENNPFGIPSRGESASMSFGLQNTLEAKVRSESDSTGVRKIKIIDQLSFNGSYNFLADSMNLSTISANLRTTIIKNFGLNLSMTFDPYDIDANGNRINRFAIRSGRLARLTSASTSFGYTFNSSKSGQAAMNDINSGSVPTPQQSDYFARNNITDPNTQRTMMASQYYDFDIPWNIGFNYSFSYSKSGLQNRITQTLGFSGSVTPTPKWGVTFSGGYDFESRKLTPGTVTITRDLHCWQMNFTWVPIGFNKSWSFNIGIRSTILRDLKYDKRSSRYDSTYD